MHCPILVHWQSKVSPEAEPAAKKKHIPLAERVKLQKQVERTEELGHSSTVASRALVAKIMDEVLLPASTGTFDEFRTKV